VVKLFDRNSALLSDAARFHDDIIVNRFCAARPSLHLLDRPSQREGNFSSLPSKPASRNRFSKALPSASLVP